MRPSVENCNFRKFAFRARYYNPETARFLSEDPKRFNGDDYNFYRYVKNSPVVYRDPEGEYGIVGAVVGGIAGIVVGAITSGGKASTIIWSAVGGFVGGFVGPGGIVGGIIFGVGWDAITNPNETSTDADKVPQNPKPEPCNPDIQSCSSNQSPNQCFAK